MNPEWIIAICAALGILAGIFNILWELKKNTLITRQIAGRLDESDARVEDLNIRLVRIETSHAVNHSRPKEASL